MKIPLATVIAGAAEFSKTPMPMTGDHEASLYFHIPFCSKKCHYCHFFVIPTDPDVNKAFVSALIQEFKMRLPQLNGKKIVSIYFGGGTPTQLPANAYLPLFEEFHRSLNIASNCEITLETNPEDVNLDRMLLYRSLGINRVSMGVQSLNDQELRMLSRTHDRNRALQAIQIIHQAGIDNLSIDLMFELPEQTLSSWEQTLNALAPLPIAHLSLYNLTLEPHTIFFKNRQVLEPKLPNEDDRLQMLKMAVDHLEALGLHRYEISAFARRGRRSIHNTGYWKARPFFGCGPSAFSYWDSKRFSNVANLKKYLRLIESGQFPVDFEECLTYPRNLQELLAVELRLVEGVDLSTFTKRHGPLPLLLENQIAKLVQKGWLTRNQDILQLTPQGQLFYDTVAIELI